MAINLQQCLTRNEIADELGMHRNTLAYYLKNLPEDRKALLRAAGFGPSRYVSPAAAALIVRFFRVSD